MSRTQIKDFVGSDYASVWDRSEVDKYFGGKTPPNLTGMKFSFTSRNELWKIQLKFVEANEGVWRAVQSRILAEKYPDAELQKVSSSSENTSFIFYYIYVIIIDQPLFAADTEKLYAEEVSKY